MTLGAGLIASPVLHGAQSRRMLRSSNLGIKGHKAISLNPAYLILTSVGLERPRVQ
ncbi:hypothetical protein [Desulfurococcus amylolyticus]|uniref:hypothetical protein n=1 Tax=Desulfurococcus amylolyticus TaxID=94694 RepID=UPI0012EBF4CC|nr:hypothetical protein [Desulfurococcus amylolyticus]